MGLTSFSTTRRGVLGLTASAVLGARPRPAHAAPKGTLTIGSHVSLAPTWFDPAETAGVVAPFMLMYAMHDAVAKAMPGNSMAPSLAESWSMTPDGLTHEFVLRDDVKYHNGDRMTSEDVKFSFERYRGASHQVMSERVAAVEAPNPLLVCFRLKAPGPIS